MNLKKFAKELEEHFEKLDSAIKSDPFVRQRYEELSKVILEDPYDPDKIAVADYDFLEALFLSPQWNERPNEFRVQGRDSLPKLR